VVRGFAKLSELAKHSLADTYQRDVYSISFFSSSRPQILSVNWRHSRAWLGCT